jgi:predicted transcriptional regulator
MADLAVVAASVAAYSDAIVETGTAGETITAGQSVYVDATTNRYKLANAKNAPPKTTVYGIALNDARAGQPLTVQKVGGINLGVAVTIGGIYVLSGTNSGGIAPVADIAAGWLSAIVGVGVTTTRLQLALANPMIALTPSIQWFDFSQSGNSGYLPLL